jgi:uncharacterized membrane protein YedE/YeeE
MAVAVHQEVARADVRLRADVGRDRFLLLLAAAAAVFGLAACAGLRFGLLLLIGLGFGAALEGLRFGFAGPWRALIRTGDPRGLLAQLLAIGLTAAVALPLLSAHPGELMGAQGPIGTAMVLGAFVFGFSMQIVLGCGSGTLVNAGSGNAIGLLALPLFVAGSFLGTLHLAEWQALGSLRPLTLQGLMGPRTALVATLAGLALVGAVLAWRAPAGQKLPQGRLLLAALLVAGLALANLVVAGQPWGVVYGLGLWGAKVATALGADLAGNGYWGLAGNAERLQTSVLTDVTSLTDLGLIAGALVAARWRGPMAAQVAPLPLRAWLAAALAALAMGYASRLAYGCNVGAFFSGIATGSLHGWIWFAAAFLGSVLGVRARPALGFEQGRMPSWRG